MGALPGTLTDVEARPGMILIVDEEPAVREVIAHCLESMGYGCRAAATAGEAWAMLEEKTIALLVVDIRLPGTPGLSLLSRVRRRFPDVAVVIVTGLDDRKTAMRALALGAYGYVVKPFEANEIVVSAVNALERRRLTLERRAYEQHLEKKVREQTELLRTSHEELALRLIAAQNYRHDETGAHVRRIGLYAEAVSQALGRSGAYGEMLRQVAPMHDIGKIGIPDEILRKPGPLTPEEFEIMKNHTVIGGRILEGGSVPLLNVAREIALCHHEWWDGSGYPHGLKRREIPETARIVAVLDVYDALVRQEEESVSRQSPEIASILTEIEDIRARVEEKEEALKRLG